MFFYFLSTSCYGVFDKTRLGNDTRLTLMYILVHDYGESHAMSKVLWLNTVRHAIYSHNHRGSRKVRSIRWISGEPLELRIAPGDLAGITSAFAAQPITELLHGDPTLDRLFLRTTNDMTDVSMSATTDFQMGSLGRGGGSTALRTLSV